MPGEQVFDMGGVPNFAVLSLPGAYRHASYIVAAYLAGAAR
jgi:hypothetical protein